MATDALMLKHQDISIQSTVYRVIILNQFPTKNITYMVKSISNYILKKNYPIV